MLAELTSAKEIDELALAPVQDLAAIADRDGEIGIWSLAGNGLRTVMRHGAQPLALAFSADGHLLVSAGADRRVMVWDVVSGARLAILRLNSSCAALAMVSGSTVIAGDRAGRVHFLQLVEPVAAANASGGSNARSSC